MTAKEKEKLFVKLSDGILISDLLYFVHNKLKSTAAKIVATTCHQFYTDDDYVYGEKKKLCDATDEFCNQRRTDDKRLKNIEDICSIISRRDAKNEFLPQFASLDFNNVPVNDDGNPSLGQIMASLHDLKRKAVTKDTLQEVVDGLKREIISASSDVTSHPFPTDETRSLPSAPPLPLSPSAPPICLSISPADNFVAPLPPPAPAAPRKWPSVSAQQGATAAPDQRNPAPTSDPLVAAPAATGGSKRIQRPKERRNISRQRDFSRPRTIIGKNVSSGLISVKGADLTVNRYVGRWDNNATGDAVTEFIVNKEVSVIELEELETKHGRFKSFRLRIRKSQLSTIEDENFWPEGVILSPFFRGKEERNRNTGGGVDSNSSNHG